MNSIRNELVNNQSTFVLNAKIGILADLYNDYGLLFGGYIYFFLYIKIE